MLMQRLSGASLLVFANKQDIQGALSPNEIAKVSSLFFMDKNSQLYVLSQKETPKVYWKH